MTMTKDHTTSIVTSPAVDTTDLPGFVQGCGDSKETIVNEIPAERSSRNGSAGGGARSLRGVKRRSPLDKVDENRCHNDAQEDNSVDNVAHFGPPAEPKLDGKAREDRGRCAFWNQDRHLNFFLTRHPAPTRHQPNAPLAGQKKSADKYEADSDRND